jgi:GH43 family beta-xylosidase
MLVLAMAAVLVGTVVASTASKADPRPVPHPAPPAVPVPVPVPVTAAGSAILGPGGSQPLFLSDVPDPYVLRRGHIYYLYGTEPWLESTNVPVWVSEDLVHWRNLGDAMPTLPSWAVPGRTWAPSILVLAHSYVLYFTAEQRSSSRQCIGTATSSNPLGPFIPSDRILECQVPRHAGSIDGEVFVDVDGTPYLMWKSEDNAIRRPSTIWAARLTPDGMHLIGVPVAMLHDDKRTWEGYTIEAPAMVHEAGQYWLFYSGSYLAAATYAIGYALCAGPLGPCVKQSVSAPWYASGPNGLGPGEESFFNDPAGNTYMAYNAWPASGVGYPHGFVRYPHIELVRFQHSAPPAVSPTAVAVAASPLRGYYVLTADGMVWPEDGAVSFGHTPIPGGLARSIAVMPDGLGYAVLDGYGGLHLFGSAKLLPVDPSISWPDWDIARAIAITPSGRGYAVLDGLGGVHPVGDAPPAPPAAATRADTADSLAIDPSDGGYAILRSDGSVVVSGDLPVWLDRAAVGVWPSLSLIMTPSGRGYATLDSQGDLATVGDAPAPPAGEPTFLAPMGVWAAGALLPDGRYVAVRTDSSTTVWPAAAAS